jgi:2-polyprenyl-3-methyl-5-hydroxy-6-metoxy-1,4-benzoquinol methylase
MPEPDHPYGAASRQTAELPRENVCGHTSKVVLCRAACERLRARRGGGSLSILDVGCGSGFAVTRFLGGAQDEVLGIDMYEPNIAYATRSYAGAGLRFECRTAESLVSEDSSYDVVVLADVLEHLTDPAPVLKTCRRLLRKDGLLLVTVPNGFGPFEAESALARVPMLGSALLKLTEYAVAAMNKFGPLKGRWSALSAEQPLDLPYNLESGHVQFFSRLRFERLLRTAGFHIAKSDNLSFLSGPFTNFLWGASRTFCCWNVAIARSLPAFAVSAWFVECTPVAETSET